MCIIIIIIIVVVCYILLERSTLWPRNIIDVIEQRDESSPCWNLTYFNMWCSSYLTLCELLLSVRLWYLVEQVVRG